MWVPNSAAPSCLELRRIRSRHCALCRRAMGGNSALRRSVVNTSSRKGSTTSASAAATRSARSSAAASGAARASAASLPGHASGA